MTQLPPQAYLYSYVPTQISISLRRNKTMGPLHDTHHPFSRCHFLCAAMLVRKSPPCFSATAGWLASLEYMMSPLFGV
jgi:hypothetical protein